MMVHTHVSNGTLVSKLHLDVLCAILIHIHWHHGAILYAHVSNGTLVSKLHLDVLRAILIHIPWHHGAILYAQACTDLGFFLVAKNN